jgi:hypothetical protein
MKKINPPILLFIVACSILPASSSAGPRNCCKPAQQMTVASWFYELFGMEDE